MIKRIATAVALTALAAVSAQAATITVNTGSDIVGDDGACSLREAITAANTNTASGAMAGECAAGDDGSGAGNPADSIAFAGGVSTAELNSTLPTITDRLVIDGGGTVTIAPASAVQTNFFIVDDINNANPGLTQVDFQNLTIQGADEQSTAIGGALRLINNGPTQQALDINNVEFRNNLNAGNGGAIGLAGNVALNIDGSRFYGNSARAGGALAVHDHPPGLADTGATPQVMISGSTFGSTTAGEGNTTTDGDGGVLLFETLHPTTSAIGDLDITDSSFIGNATAGLGSDGGALDISNGGVVNITNANFDANTAVADGGAVWFLGYPSSGNVLTISGSSFTGNSVGGDAGALRLGGDDFYPVNISTSSFDANSAGASGGAVRILWTNQVTIESSTLSNNTATFSGGAVSLNAAGAPAGEKALLKLVNSTVSGNQAARSGGGISFGGVTSNVQLYSSTVTNNLANSDDTGNETGGGFSGHGTGTETTMANSIVADNTVGTGGSKPDCDAGGGGIVSQDYNIIGDNFGCTPFSAANKQANDQVGDVAGGGAALDPMLGALASNGGPTETHDLLAGSPALDTGNPAGCLDDTGATLTTDQRGFTRPDGAACDVGAVEFQSTPPVADVVASANNGAVMPTSATAGDADIEAVGVKFTNNSSETLELASLTLDASGPNAAADITAVNLYADTNCNGDIDSGENTAIASAAGFGQFPIAPAITLAAGAEACFVATIDTNTVLAAWAMPLFAASGLVLIGFMGLGGSRRRGLILVLVTASALGLVSCHGDSDRKGSLDDPDKDGIPSQFDLCPGTPPHTLVGLDGCPLTDSDGDGVDDSIDACPGTPAGTAVDAAGCPVVGSNSANYTVSVTAADITESGTSNAASISGLPVSGQTITVTEP